MLVKVRTSPNQNRRIGKLIQRFFLSIRRKSDKTQISGRKSESKGNYAHYSFNLKAI